jgi:hypothetical protein
VPLRTESKWHGSWVTSEQRAKCRGLIAEHYAPGLRPGAPRTHFSKFKNTLHPRTLEPKLLVVRTSPKLFVGELRLCPTPLEIRHMC